MDRGDYNYEQDLYGIIKPGKQPGVPGGLDPTLAGDAFSEALDRGFAMRGRVHTFNSSVCYHERKKAPSKDVDDSMACGADVGQ